MVREGEAFGNYAVKGPIGMGGMGAVYRAVHPEIGKVVAVKVLRPELARDDRAITRFFDEARAVNAIRHDGIVDIFDLGRRNDGTVYLVMEYLAGEDLAQLLDRERRLSPARAAALIRQVCDSVGAAHRRGIVHRDLKPQNLFIVPRSGEARVKVLDFGIAKLLHDSSSRPDTNSGVVLGTVQYMSPEQATGNSVDGRTDIYSLGCILYEMLTGVPPFDTATVLEAVAARVGRTPIAPSARTPEANLPAGLDAVVMRALAREPADRYSDTEELSAALAALDLRESSASWHPPTMSTVADRGGTLKTAAPPRVEPAVRVVPAVPREPDRPPSKDTSPRERTITPAPTSSPTPLLDSGPISEEVADPVARRLLEDGAQTALDAPPLIDAESERRVIRAVIPVLFLLLSTSTALYFLPKRLADVDHAVLRRWLTVFGADVLAMVAMLLAVARTQHRSRTRWVLNRLMTLLAVATITTSLHVKGSVTSYDVLNYPLLVIIDRVRENRALARLTVVASTVSYVGLVLIEHFGLVSYAPLHPGKVSPAVIGDWGMIGLNMLVVPLITVISYALINFLGTRVQKREQELRELGRGLAGRIEEQIQLLRRSERLQRYVSPQLAEAILRGEAPTMPHERRRLTLVRLDCPAIAQAAEKVEPEEFAGLLNQFYARLSDLAVVHGGVVDRFWGAELTVLLGAPHSQGATEDARSAVRFALASLPVIRNLSRACEVAGVEEAPLGRAVLHTGFATVGSFGSPSRLAYTAVGPIMEATTQMLSDAPSDVVRISHATYVLLRDDVEVEPDSERVLSGAHHAVKVYRVRRLNGD